MKQKKYARLTDKVSGLDHIVVLSIVEFSRLTLQLKLIAFPIKIYKYSSILNSRKNN